LIIRGKVARSRIRILRRNKEDEETDHDPTDNSHMGKIVEKKGPLPMNSHARVARSGFQNKKNEIHMHPRSYEFTSSYPTTHSAYGRTTTFFSCVQRIIHP
jgi:hypothetical protein